MIDTRIEGRTKQAYAWYGDPFDAKVQPYTWADYTAGLTPVGGVYPDAANKMMSDTQFKWLTDNINSATSSWQIIGNQDIMAKLWYPATVVAANAQGVQAFQTAVGTYLARKAGNPANTASDVKIPINMDSWDGYPGPPRRGSLHPGTEWHRGACGCGSGGRQDRPSPDRARPERGSGVAHRCQHLYCH